LQATFAHEVNGIRVIAEKLNENISLVTNRVANVEVRFMNTADVTVVITVIANFLIQIVLYLWGNMEYEKHIFVNSAVDVQ
jgi:hypothetical protein